nr:DegT/DnrJ/EryC1/StrS family aminotransferase [Bacteroidota bacterium]
NTRFVFNRKTPLSADPKYNWVDIESSYLPSDILAAFLYAQLEHREKIQEKREKIWKYYYKHLKGWADENNVRLSIIPEHCDQPYHLFYLLMPSLEKRTAFINYLKGNGITAVFHYLPLHISDWGKKFGGKEGDCLVTEDVSDMLARLPFFNNMTETELEIVVNTISAFKT